MKFKNCDDEFEGKRERECECVCMWVCVRERGRERVGERERERERDFWHFINKCQETTWLRTISTVRKYVR